MTFTYTNDGARIPFEPARMRDQLAGCCLCGAPVAMVGVFRPVDDRMRQAVLTLRRHPIPAGCDISTTYGLCALHASDPDFDRIERMILAAAAKVTVQ